MKKKKILVDESILLDVSDRLDEFGYFLAKQANDSPSSNVNRALLFHKANVEKTKSILLNAIKKGVQHV